MAASTTVRVDSNGRLVVPAVLRRQLGFDPGVTLVLELHGKELRVRRLHEAVAEAQASLRAYVSVEEPSPIDELIEDRRAEAKRQRTAPRRSRGQP